MQKSGNLTRDPKIAIHSNSRIFFIFVIHSMHILTALHKHIPVYSTYVRDWRDQIINPEIFEHSITSMLWKHTTADIYIIKYRMPTFNKGSYLHWFPPTITVVTYTWRHHIDVLHFVKKWNVRLKSTDIEWFLPLSYSNNNKLTYLMQVQKLKLMSC